MIRKAERADIPRMVEMGQRFRRETPYAQYLADNPEKMAELGEKLISTHGLLVSERDSELVGMLGYIVHDHFISNERVAGEVFWWVEPEFRGEGVKLLKDTEKRARLAGAKHLQMIAPNEKVAHFYQRMGYAFVESTYQRTL